MKDMTVLRGVTFWICYKRVAVVLAVVLAISLETKVEAAEVSTLEASQEHIIIEVEGLIGPLTAVQLGLSLFTNTTLRPNAELSVVLNSPGGSVRTGLAMAKLLRVYKAETHVLAETQCSSACTIAFLGGVKRYSSGVLGYHNAYYETEPGVCKEGEGVQGFIEGQSFAWETADQLLEYIDDSKVRSFIAFYSAISKHAAENDNRIFSLKKEKCEQVGVCKY